ncbi:MAG: VIT1/CCC1 transporter family protein [Bacteroidales bacterium]
MQSPLPVSTRWMIRLAMDNEITEYHIYSRLASRIRDPHNAAILAKIAGDEKRHASFWEKHLDEKAVPKKFKIFWFFWIAKIFGITFGLKLLEKSESKAEQNYQYIAQYIPEAKQIAADEEAHEKELIALLQEEKLEYIGSIVLGLNDALVELTGALAGFTLALQQNKVIAMAGLITGVAAAFSMASSEYLSNKAENAGEKASRASLYTGLAYILTVFLLIFPYFIFSDPLASLACTLCIAVLIIFVFNYYISVAKDLPFRKRFIEMTLVSLGVSALSFLLAWGIKSWMGVEV